MSTQKCNVCKIMLSGDVLWMFSTVMGQTLVSFCFYFLLHISLGPSFLFLSQRLQQESHGRPLQADALQLVLHFVLEISEPD